MQTPLGSKQLLEVAGVIGGAAAQRLCEVIGGVRTYIPAHIPSNHPIHLAIGKEAAAKLAAWGKGLFLELPKAHLQRQRALELIEQGEMTIREIALATDYTERRIYQLMAEAKGDERQLDLFARRS